MAAASIVVGKAVVPQEEGEEEGESLDHERDDLDIAVHVEEAGQAITRRRFLTRAAGAAGLTLVGALVVPLASCGPFLDVAELRRTGWHNGRRLVNDAGRPLRADELAIGSMTPAFAEGLDRERLDASLLVVRIPPRTLRLPRDRAGWAPDSISRLLEDLHARGVRRVDVPLPALLGSRTAAGARLPVPLLDPSTLLAAAR